MAKFGGSKNVLLVENDPAWQLIISRALKAIEPGATLHSARSVGHAVDMLTAGARFDLVISDIFLNGKETGLDLHKFIRAKRKNVPVMMISSLTTEEFNGQFAWTDDKPAFFSKSLEVERLKFILSQELRRTSTLDRAVNFGMFGAALALAFAFTMPTRLLDATHLAGPKPTSVQPAPAAAAVPAAAPRGPAQQKSLIDMGSQLAEKIVDDDAAHHAANVQNTQVKSDK